MGEKFRGRRKEEREENWRMLRKRKVRKYDEEEGRRTK